MELRRNLLSYSAVPFSPFFLLALPDAFYLWKQQGAGTLEQATPDLVIDARRALAPYLKGFTEVLDTVSGTGFELLVQAWLQDLVRSSSMGSSLEDQAETSGLRRLGLLDAIRGGSIESEATFAEEVAEPLPSWPAREPGS